MSLASSPDHSSPSIGGSAASAAALAAGVCRPAIAQSEPIRIGYLPALTGPSSSTGIGINRGTELAVKEINAAGGIKGRQIELIVRDTQSDPTKAVNAATELTPAHKVAHHLGAAELRRGAGGDAADRARQGADAAPVLGRRADRREEVPDGVPQRADQPPGRRRRKPLRGRRAQGQEGGGGQRHHGLRHGLGQRLRADAQGEGRRGRLPGSVEANNPDLKPEMLRMQAPARRPSCPGASTPASCRASSTRARRWTGTCRSSARRRWAPARPRPCSKKPEYWKKVYPNNFRNCCYDAAGKLPPRTAEFVERLRKAKIEMSDTLLWWIALGYDGPRLMAEAIKDAGSEPEEIVGYWNKVKGWPGVYGSITWTPEQHNGFPNEEVVMCEANSLKDGAFTLAPGYSAARSRCCESIVSYGLAVGAVYALIGITYNVMFSASRVFSFTAGMVGMLGGVFGALFIDKLGMPVIVGFVAHARRRRRARHVTEIVTVRPVLKSLEQHLYVLSTLAFALMIQQLTAIEWGTEAQPFPRLLPIGPGIFDQQFWLPLLACAATIVGPRVALSPDPDRPRLPGDLRGQLRRPRARPARAAAAHGELCAGRRDRHPGGLHRRAR